MCIRDSLTTGQPDVGGDNALMGSQYQHLVFQVVLLAGLHIPPLIQIAAVHASKIGSVIDNDRPLTFEKFVQDVYKRQMYNLLCNASILHHSGGLHII